jgi:uncharacterized protein
MDRTALLAGVALFDAGRYFEAHEVWEGPWLTEPDPQVRRFLQALIQMAAGFHKLRSPAGEASASRLLGKGLAKLADLPDELLGIDVAGLRRAAREWKVSLGSGAPPAIGHLVPPLL